MAIASFLHYEKVSAQDVMLDYDKDPRPKVRFFTDVLEVMGFE